MDHNELVEALGELSVKDVFDIISDTYQDHRNVEHQKYTQEREEYIFDLQYVLRTLSSRYKIPSTESEELYKEAVNYRVFLTEQESVD